MTANKTFVMLCFLLTSAGFLLCTSLKEEKRVKTLPIKNRVIGIHLGMTYSSVGLYKRRVSSIGPCRPRKKNCGAITFYNDTMEVVKNEQGSTTTPSCVSFTDDLGVLIGEEAKDQEAVNPERTICEINRLLGKRFDDLEVQDYIKTLPYKVVNKENKPCIEIEFKNGETKLFRPEDICAMIAGKMKDIAETYIDHDVEYAVILVEQSYIDSEVRQNIHGACVMTGLQIAFVLPSFGVVALSSLWNQRNFRALIYDLGDSTFNATLLDCSGMGMLMATSPKGDWHLGGQTFDTRLVDYFVSLLKRKYNNDIRNDLNALKKLRIECEKAKISLSKIDRVIIKIEFDLVDDEILIFEETLTRETFEELNMDLFNRTMELVKDVLKEGGIEKTDIDEIILVGGSTQIPMIQHLLRNYFGKDTQNVVFMPNKALVRAATKLAGNYVNYYAPYAGVLSENFMSLGIETMGGVMTQFIDAGRRPPYIKSRNLTTYYDGQTTMEIKVFEGGRKLTKYCHYLGNLKISNLPSAPRGVTIVEVTVELHAYWDITVTAEHKATENKKSMVILYKERKNRLHDRKQDILEIEKYDEEDVKVLENIKFAMSLYQPQPRSMGFASVLQTSL